MPSNLEQLEMRSQLTPRKRFTRSLRGYLESVLWMRTRNSMPRAKDIFEYWRLVDRTFKFVDMGLTKELSKMLLVDYMSRLFWVEVRSFSLVQALGVELTGTRVYLTPELDAVISMFNSGRSIGRESIRSIQKMILNLPSPLAKRLGSRALFSWILLLSMFEPKTPIEETKAAFENLGRNSVLTTLFQRVYNKNNIRNVIRSLRFKIELVKAELLLTESGLEFMQAAVNHLFYFVWLLEEINESREVYELEAQLRTIKLFA